MLYRAVPRSAALFVELKWSGPRAAAASYARAGESRDRVARACQAGTQHYEYVPQALVLLPEVYSCTH